MRRRLFSAAAVAILSMVGLTAAAPASADPALPSVVSADPVDTTPHILDGTVLAITLVGDTVVVGGNFTKITNSAGTRTYPRNNIFAYGLYDGVIRPFAPTVDGPIRALAPGAANTVYIGGSFRKVNGANQRGLARLLLRTGARVTTFKARINWGDVRAMQIQGVRLYVGGAFSAINGVKRTALARLSAGTGAVDLSFDARLSAPGLRRTRVEHFDLSPDGRRLVAVGAILKAGGLNRTQLVLLNVTRGAVVANWYTNAYKPPCLRGFDTYLRQVKFAPNGFYFVVVTTGRITSPTNLCDTAARFNVAGKGLHNPVWVQHTGGDSLYAVAVTGPAVYVGGHQRYLDNPHGTDFTGPGPGAVSRPGIGALHPLTGRALPWNPTRTRGVGVRAFLSTPIGLIVGSDTDRLGHEYHGRIGMFPLS